MEMNSTTELYCIFGKPVRHSLSPLMHNTAFRTLGINAVYLAFEPIDIGSAIGAMRSLKIRGASVTIPYKIDAIQHVDSIDPVASDIGSINTLINSDGVIAGYNTDGYGAMKALEDKNTNIASSSFLVIGNGGSARAIAFTLLKHGASVIIAGRDRQRVTLLYEDLKKKYPDVTSSLIQDLDAGTMKGVNVVINTTPLGMAPDIASIPINESLLQEHHTVFDIVYSPDTTRLLSAAQQKGCVIVRGIDMLAHQGAEQFKIWTGLDAPLDAMLDCIKKGINKI